MFYFEVNQNSLKWRPIVFTTMFENNVQAYSSYLSFYLMDNRNCRGILWAWITELLFMQQQIPRHSYDGTQQGVEN